MDLILNNAIRRSVMETMNSAQSSTFDGIKYDNDHYGPACTDEELKQVLDELVAEGKLKIMKEHYVLPGMTRRDFMRFFYEG